MTANQHKPLSFIYTDIAETGMYRGKLEQFAQWVQQMPECNTLPFFIFSDLLPQAKQLADLLLRLQGQPAVNLPCVLVVKKIIPGATRLLWEAHGPNLYDVLEWSGQEDLIAYITALAERNRRVSSVLQSTLVKQNLIGESAVWLGFLREVIEAALFSQGSILLLGASGTGKELLSRLVHTIDMRPGKRELVLLDCTTIVPELAGSEFFGHEKGAYTNAHQARDGAFALANEGTLFLDEISELPLPLQAGLLRVIQEGKYKKVGSNTWQNTRFRLVCATNKDLRQQGAEGGFRQDLFFRIADFEFKVPALSERPGDIPLLATHFLREFCPLEADLGFDASVLDYLVNRPYPGNVRELRQLVRRIALKHLRHNKITMGEVPLQDRGWLHKIEAQESADAFRAELRHFILAGNSLWDLKKRTTDEAIQIALDLSNGNKNMAARRLGVTWRAILQFRKKNKMQAE